MTPDTGGDVQERLCTTVAGLQCTGTCLFLYSTPLFFSGLLALWGCSYCHFQTSHQGVSLHFAIRRGVVPQCSPRGAGLPLDRPWHGHTRLFSHLSQGGVCSEMSHISDATTSQLQGILQRHALKVQQRSWLGKKAIFITPKATLCGSSLLPI